ncbi:hypothetical protein GLW00_06035 [Halobacillus litoralis]|uniref:Uncharacterized protein n=1 Tax=Halobacillus litoralis TaxID=45668 RepID=A0A845F9P2_9BACI|nr:hypothetical protein [Halobacillus litoralis]MYL70396.1 hypothetical protein [Halobacillus litoralis]
MKRLAFVMVLVLFGAMPVDAVVVKEEKAVERSKNVDVTQVPSTLVLYDTEMKRRIQIESVEGIMRITEGVNKAAPVKGRWTKSEKLGTLDFGDEEMIHIYYGDERENVYLISEEETVFMSRIHFFDLFYRSVNSLPLPPGEGGDVQPLPPGQPVQPDDFLPL